MVWHLRKHSCLADVLIFFHEDFWMPFGPSILSTRIDDYLINPMESPYMMMAFDTTEKRDDISAGLHPYDFTSRPQTVNSEYN